MSLGEIKTRTCRVMSYDFRELVKTLPKALLLLLRVWDTIACNDDCSKMFQMNISRVRFVLYVLQINQKLLIG